MHPPSLLLPLALVCSLAFATPADAQDRWWPEPTEQALARAGANRPQWTLALETVPRDQRESLTFLLENMPAADLRTLSAKSLLENVAQAAAAFAQAPWASAVPREIFLNEVLPYANASERRDDWRADLRARCTPLVAGCRTPAEAALRLNERLFSAVNVRYSTARAKADQSPAESMASGLASCTGLAILLVDACRAVGVPARLAGIPNWSDGRGNHTWVEFWDGGSWHFVGAAEPDARGADHAWFERDAALAQKAVPEHAIYAVSFRRTGTIFPIAWGADSGDVSAENVTDRYARASPTPAPATVRVMLRIRDRPGGPRVPAAVQLTSADSGGAPASEGTSTGEQADANHLLTFDLPQGQPFDVTATFEGRTLRHRYVTPRQPQDTLDLAFEPAPTVNPATRESLEEALKGFFAAPASQQKDWKFDPALDRLLQTSPAAVRSLAWETFRASPVHASLRADHAAKLVRFDKYVSPYTIRAVGTKPAGGWGLVIAMHGGGGAPKEVNDQQWEIMQRYYRDQPQADGYLYLALRAPNDEWNGFYDDYVYPLVANLLRQLAICEEMDLNKVCLLGYSHGGYGAFAIGPKMPDRFAAIHSSAAAPTDGETSAKTLRNTFFTFWVGEFDTAYDRRKRCEAFDGLLASLRGPRVDIFPTRLEVKMGREHSNLPDHDELQELLPRVRNPVPQELTWEQTDGVIQDFYWLHDARPGKKQELDATIRKNILTIESAGASRPFSVFLDERLIDLSQPVTVEYKGESKKAPLEPRLGLLCEGIATRADPALAFTVRLDFP